MFHENVFPFAYSPKEALFNLIYKSLSSIPIHHSNPSSHPIDYDDMFVLAPHSSDQESVSHTLVLHITTLYIHMTLWYIPTGDTLDHIPNLIDETHVPRKSNKNHRTPAYLQDYYCPTKTTNQHTTSLSLSALFSQNQNLNPNA